jgi:hypothetical protein
MENNNIKTIPYRTREDGVNLVKSFSINGLRIRKVGTDEVYDDAIDIEGFLFSYEETNEAVEINSQDNENIQAKAKAYDIIVGEEE